MTLSPARTATALGAVAVFAVLTLTACSSSSPSATAASTAASTPASTAVAAPASANSSSTTPSSASGITIKNFGFTGELTVQAGQVVTVTNEDSVAHTLTDKATKLFDTGNIPGNGGTGTFTAPTKPGSYPFGCTYHPEMAGTLIVQ
jgi:plastocyanin